MLFNYIIYSNQMSKSRNKKSKNPQVPIFISKLADILENHQIADIVSWTTTRDSFIIKNITKFTEQTLPSYFKHHNFASFIRQLNMYGFNKKRHPDGDNVYMNEYFKEGSRHLLSNIVRKNKQEKEQTVAIYNASQPLAQTRVSREIQELKNKQKNLQQMCKRFLVQNQRLLQQNQSIVQRMDKESKEKEKRLEEFLIYLVAQKNAKALTEQGGGQLSIMNAQAPIPLQNNYKDSNATPLQLLAENMDRDQNFKKMKNMIQGAYNTKRSNKKKDNFTIVNSKKEQPLHMPHEMLSENHLHQYSQDVHLLPPPVNDPKQQDNKSFISINDFINAQGYQDFDLEESI